jgi:hypothetical protein
MGSDDFSLVGLAALARDTFVLTSLRESAVLYAEVCYGASSEIVTFEYEWAVDPIVAGRAERFVSTFNALFSETLPAPTARNAELFWNASTDASPFGRCVRLGYDDSASPIRHYHWAVLPVSDAVVVRDFWSTEVWTTERLSAALIRQEKLPFPV